MTLNLGVSSGTSDVVACDPPLAAPKLLRAAVVGAGALGACLAAQLACAGVRVLLLDRADRRALFRNDLAERGVEAQLRLRKGPSPDWSRLVETGNIDDDLARIFDADWIIETVLEDIVGKRELLVRIDRHRKPDAVMSSCTESIPLAHLVEGLGDRISGALVLSRFPGGSDSLAFAEIVDGKQTAPGVAERVRGWVRRVSRA